MRLLSILAVAACAWGQQPPFTLDQVLGAPFPTELTASPTAGRVAWVANLRGVRNIFAAESPGYQPRKLTTYSADDGQEIASLRWLPDSTAIVYVRGGSANPGLDPKGVSEDICIVPFAGGAPRKLAEGHDPAVSPGGDRVAFVHSGQIWWASVDGKTPAAAAFHARGANSRPSWSPDGRRVSFISDRGDHSLIGVYDTTASTLRYLDPSTDHDGSPEWSPDGRSVAFIRIPSSGLRTVREPHRTAEPWSIRIASAETGAARQLWRAREGKGSAFREVASENQLLWAAGRVVFPWEADGWTHLYAIAPEGGQPALLTPGEFEVEHAALDHDRREVVYSSNQDDIDRRHLWRVPVTGGQPVALTHGQGIEVFPAPTANRTEIAFLRSDAQHPAHPAILAGTAVRDIDPIASDFPLRQMVTPRQVVFPAPDGLQIHGQLFQPPNQPAGRVPAVVFFHGGSRRQMLLGWHSMYYYANAYALNQYLANSGYIVLSVNYRSGIGYGLDFREALNYGASGGSEYHDVEGAAAYLRSRPDVDAARIGAWGGSYGGYLVAMALARASDRFKAGVDFHGVHNWATELNIPPGAPDYKIAFESSPMNFLAGWRSPVLLMQGDDDPDVQFNQTVMLADALRKQKVDMEEIVFPDEVHDFLLYRTWRTAYAAAVDFLKRKL